MDERMFFWIIGYGKYGKIALERLFASFKYADFVVVDVRNIETIDAMYGKRVHFVKREGVNFLAANLDCRKGQPSFIVPTLPVHLAFEWVCEKISEIYLVEKVEVPGIIYDRLPNVRSGPLGKVYTSYSTWYCPDKCLGGEIICMVEKKRRHKMLYELISEIKFSGLINIVLRSVQILPGVGGYQPKDLWEALGKIVNYGTGYKYILSTACSCHGVIDFFSLKEKRKAR